MTDIDFSEEQIERYSRHLVLAEVGVEGQRKLLASRVLVVGAGGLGSPALLYLAAAGVGRLGIADGDAVELSNLQRQVIHRSSDVGRRKTASARRAIRALNPECIVHVFSNRLTSRNIRRVMRGWDVVLDCSDNFPARFLVADCARFENIPLVSASVLRFEGHLMTVLPGKGRPCYRCFVPEPPPAGDTPSCGQVGVLGAVVGVMGTLQATEALKLLLGIGDPLSDRLLIYDALRCRFTMAKRRRDPACPLCGDQPTITELIDCKVECCPGGKCDVVIDEDIPRGSGVAPA